MDEVFRQIAPVFVEEVREQADAIAAALLDMESKPASLADRIEELYRHAHSLKGSSSSLGIVELEQLAHNLEEVLLPVRRRQAALTAEMTDVGLRATQAMKLRCVGLLEDSDVGADEVHGVIASLMRLASGGEPSGVGPGTVASGEARDDRVARDMATQIVRVSAERIEALERRLHDLRGMQARLGERVDGVSQAAMLLDTMWRQTRYRSDVASTELASSLEAVAQRLQRLRRELREDAGSAEVYADQLAENLHAMRMVEANLWQQPLAQAVREVCRRVGKEAAFTLSGGEVQFDRRLLDEMKGPLLHLVRNAVAHGIESPAARVAAGKPPQGSVQVLVEQHGRTVTVEVADDGRGIDGAAVRQRAVEIDLLTAEQAATLSELQTYDLLFRSGFSTSDKVDEVSGRGIGLDVVRDSMMRLSGQVTVHSRHGKGSRFVLTMPLTIAGSETICVEEGERAFALPLGQVETVVRVERSAIKIVGGQATFDYAGTLLPVQRLCTALGLRTHHDGSQYCTLAVVPGPTGRVALQCERFLGLRSLVLRPLPRELQRIEILSNVAALPSGKPLFVLSLPAILKALRLGHAGDLRPSPPKSREPVVLVADDSITTRSLLRTTLESSGYIVHTAVDGEEALRIILTSHVDLVVSDVRMPRLDGFALTKRVRAEPRTAKLPVVLFSALDSDADMRNGPGSGADYYLTKKAFDRGQLLEVVTALLHRTGQG